MITTVRVTSVRVPLVRYFSLRNNILYSGHNKWSTIKHDKMKNDSLKNKLINRYVNQITVAIKLKNTKVNNLIETAMKANVPKKVIENAVKKATMVGTAGEGTVNIYEGMGPGGVALIIETQTDNKNRTVALVRSHFNKAGLSLLSMNSSMHYFDKVGKIVLTYPDNTLDEDTILDKIIEVEGIKDFEKMEDEAEEHDGTEGTIQEIEEEQSRYLVLTEPTMTNKVAKQLQDEQGFEVQEANIEYLPKEEMKVDLSDNEDIAQAFVKFVNGLKDIDEVGTIYSNVIM